MSKKNSETTIDLSSPEIQEAIKSQVEQAVSGLKTKNEELIGKIKTQTEQLKSFEGIDPERTREVLSKLEQDEDARLVAEGKLDEVVEKRVANMRKDYDGKYNELTSQLEKEQGQVKAYKSKAISAEIVKSGSAVGVIPSALNDIILRAQGQFDMDEKGNVIAVDQEGNAIYDADGQTPLSVENWVSSLKKDAPHLFLKANASQVHTQAGTNPHVGKLGDSEAERKAYFANKYNLPI